jgi:hypothetical protein
MAGAGHELLALGVSEQSRAIASPSEETAMSLFDRSRAVVFESVGSIGSRRAFSEQRFQVATKVRASALVRIRYEAEQPAPSLRLRAAGVLTLRGPQARIRFRHGAGGEIDESVEPDVVDTVLVPAGTTLPVNEPSICRRDFAPPLVWISFVDFSGTTLSPPVCVGRPTGESLHVEPLFEFPVLATVWLAARSVSRQGPTIDLTGELQFRDGCAMRITLGQECDRFGSPERTCKAFDVEVVARGGTLPVPPRRVSAPVRGAPFVSLEVRDWDGRGAGREIPVGWLTPLN